jgi:Fe-S cluster biogenesis protein NfuA
VTVAPGEPAREPEVAARIERRLADIEANTDPETRARVEALVGELLSLYGDALARILAEAADGPALLAAVEKDPLVAGILSIHGLRSEPVEARVEKALDEVRPYISSHAGSVTFRGIDEQGRVHLQLDGTCKSCPSSRDTLDSRIRLAIERAAPEVTGIEVASVADAHEVCELCGVAVAPKHRHVVDLSSRAVRCACPSCAMLFTDSAGGRFRSIPDRVLRDSRSSVDAAAWSALGVPVHLSYLWFDSTLDRWVAHVPSPAGVVEVELKDGAWAALARDVPLLGALVHDVEALLVYGRRGASTLDSLLVPIDACFELAGGVRKVWKGMDGGDEVRSLIEAQLAGLRSRSRPFVGPT